MILIDRKRLGCAEYVSSGSTAEYLSYPAMQVTKLAPSSMLALKYL